MLRAENERRSWRRMLTTVAREMERSTRESASRVSYMPEISRVQESRSLESERSARWAS